MTVIDTYVRRVMEQIPEALAERQRIESDLRAHLGETGEAEGDTDAVRRMGSAEAVALGYLAEIPREYASFGARALAFVLDVALGLVLMVAVACVLAGTLFVLGHRPAPPTSSILLATTAAQLLTIALMSVAYFPLLEWRFGQTLGKRLVGIHVVREDGRRISLLQAAIRRIPFFLEFFWIDAVVALFTERHQRAFDLVARTVVTRVRPMPAPVPKTSEQGA